MLELTIESAAGRRRLLSFCDEFLSLAEARVKCTESHVVLPSPKIGDCETGFFDWICGLIKGSYS